MKIYLYTPSPNLGGTETLALRLAIELKNRYMQVVIVSDSDGWLYRNGVQYGIEVCTPLNFLHTNHELSDNFFIITSAKYLFDEHIAGHRDRTVFWLLHPLEFIWTRYKRIFRAYEYVKARNCGLIFRLVAPAKFRELKEILSTLMQRRSLVSMSKDCTDFTNRFLGTTADIPTIPLPISIVDQYRKNKMGIRRIENVAYYGRIEQFKVASIKRLIKDYSHCPTWKGKALILFGFGAAEDEILNFAAIQGVKIEITGKVTTRDVVERALVENMVVFTMGLSGLDLLSADVPAVFLPIPRAANDNQGNYAFLSCLSEGCLGSYPEFLDQSSGNTFTEITEICEDGRIWDMLKNDKGRISLQHDTTTAVDRLLNIATNISRKPMSLKHG